MNVDRILLHAQNITFYLYWAIWLARQNLNIFARHKYGFHLLFLQAFFIIMGIWTSCKWNSYFWKVFSVFSSCNDQMNFQFIALFYYRIIFRIAHVNSNKKKAFLSQSWTKVNLSVNANKKEEVRKGQGFFTNQFSGDAIMVYRI